MKRFSADLRKVLPRIPKVSGAGRFRAFSDAGRRLCALHIGYETADVFSLSERQTGLGLTLDDYGKYRVNKMRYGGNSGNWDKTSIIHSDCIVLEGIPPEAHRYMLGSRSAVDGVVERYQVKTDKASGIVSDPDAWARENEEPRYIIDLLGRVVTVSIETMRVVDDLPSLGLEGSWDLCCCCNTR